MKVTVRPSKDHQKRIDRSLQLMRQLQAKLEQAAPKTSKKLIGGFAANLLDLWETGQMLDAKLKQLSSLSLPRDQEQLGEVLTWISAIQIDMARFWIGEIEKDLEKIQRTLHKSRSRKTPRVSVR